MPDDVTFLDWYCKNCRFSNVWQYKEKGLMHSETLLCCQAVKTSLTTMSDTVCILYPPSSHVLDCVVMFHVFSKKGK